MKFQTAVPIVAILLAVFLTVPAVHHSTEGPPGATALVMLDAVASRDLAPAPDVAAAPAWLIKEKAEQPVSMIASLPEGYTLYQAEGTAEHDGVMDPVATHKRARDWLHLRIT